MSDDVEFAVIDSLKRQIVEAKRQIEQIKNRNKAKFLEIRRKTDQRKARIVLTTLKLKKQLQDLQNFFEENKKQWENELKNSEEQVAKYEEQLKQEKSYKISKLTQIINALTEIRSAKPDSEDTLEARNVSSSDITIEQECSTDIVYLSTFLKAVIEGSTLDKLSRFDKLSLRLLTIARDTQKYLKHLIKGESLKTTKTSVFQIPNLKPLTIEESPLKILNQSEFSFSSPEIKEVVIESKDQSVSSEWRVEGDLISENSQSVNESAKWNSISIIDIHTSSMSQGSEGNESSELLASKKKIQEDARSEKKEKISCFKKVFCCICRDN